MDLATINAAFGAAKSIKELGKGLLDAKIDQGVKDRFREMLEKIGNFQEALYFLRDELLTQQQENANLKARIDELNAQLDQRSKVKYIKPSYWIIDGEEKDGPFCQKCYDASGGKLLIRLQQSGSNDYWVCFECKAHYQGPDYVQPKPQKRTGTPQRPNWMSRW